MRDILKEQLASYNAVPQKPGDMFAAYWSEGQGISNKIFLPNLTSLGGGHQTGI